MDSSFFVLYARYDKLKRNYLSTVLLGGIMVWLPL